MAHTAALPFELHRKDDVVGALEITSTKETVHGLLRLDGERLIVQWRTARSTNLVGKEIRTDREIEPVREIVLPLTGMASARVRRLWWKWPPGTYIVLTASDLRTFEGIAGMDGLRMGHPAELVLRVRRSDRLLAEEFAAEVGLAVAELALREGREEADLPDARPQPALHDSRDAALPQPRESAGFRVKPETVAAPRRSSAGRTREG